MGIFRRREPTPPAPLPERVEKITPGAPGVLMELGNRHWRERESISPHEFLHWLRGRRGLEFYKEMASNDATVGGILFTAKMVLRSVEWTAEPTPSRNGEVTDEDIDRADFLSTCMNDMSLPWPDFVSAALDNMLVYGFSPHEIVYKVRMGDNDDPRKRSKFDDRRLGWRKFSPLGATTIEEFLLDQHGGLRGVLQGTRAGTRVEIPVDRLLLFRTDHRHWGGTSVLRTAAESYYTKKRLQDMERIGIERDLIGIPIVYAPPDYYATHGADLRKIVTNARVDEQAGMVFPDLRDDKGNRRLEFQVVNSGGTKAYDVDKTINRYNRDIAMSIAQDVLILGHERVGTQALAREKRDLSDLALSAWLGEFEGVLNAFAVPRLFRLNGLDTKNLPRIVAGEIRAGDLETFASAFKEVASVMPDLIAADDIETMNEIRRRLGLPPTPEG